MSINWKRCMLVILFLATLSLFGCGNSDPVTAPVVPTPTIATKPVTGFVSDPDTGLALPNANVTAYAINDAGVKSTTILSLDPASVTTGADGRYTLNIPADYDGSVMIEAEVGPGKLIDKLAKMVFATAGTKIKSAISKKLIQQAKSDNAPIPPVMVSFATNAVVVFIEENTKVGSTVTGFTPDAFSSDNIRKANVVMETFFGTNFTQLPPPATLTDVKDGTKAQQDLMVSIKAFSTVSANTTIMQIVTAMVTPAGLGDIANTIKSAINTVVKVTLVNNLPKEYTASAAINTAITNAASAPVPSPSLDETTPPAAPATLAAIADNARTISLTWNASTSADVVGYSVYRSEASGAYSALETLGKDAVAYKDVTVKPATAYSYKIVAFDAARNVSAASNVATVTTPAVVNPADTTAPDAPSGLTFNVGETQANLSWTQPAATDVAGYNVYRDSQLIAVVTGTLYKDTSLSAGKEYTYYIKAFDASSNISIASTSATVKTPVPTTATRPDKPTGLVLTPSTTEKPNPLYGKVAIEWTVSASADVIIYNVYRGAEQIAKGISSNRYTDVSVIPNSTVTYTVTAEYKTPTAQKNGESDKSAELIVTVPASPVVDTPPTIPANLALASVTANAVALKWDASTGIVAGYEILRAVGTNGTYAVIATVTQPGYTDTAVVASSAYGYQVKAYSSKGARSGISNTLSVTTPTPVDLTDVTPPTAPTNLVATLVGNSVSLSWTASTDLKGVTKYRVFRGNAQIGESTVTSFSDNTVVADTTYSYTVKAYDAAGNESVASSAVTVKTPPTPTGPNYTITASGQIASAILTLPALPDVAPPTVPTSLTATLVGLNQVNLVWGASTDQYGASVAYQVYQNDVLLTKISTASFVKNSLAEGTKYCYTIKAVDPSGNLSAATAQACVTTGTTPVIPGPQVSVNGSLML